MAAFGAERKLLFEVNCFRFCPFCDIQDHAVERRGSTRSERRPHHCKFEGVTPRVPTS